MRSGGGGGEEVPGRKNRVEEALVWLRGTPKVKREKEFFFFFNPG